MHQHVFFQNHIGTFLFALKEPTTSLLAKIWITGTCAINYDLFFEMTDGDIKAQPALITVRWQAGKIRWLFSAACGAIPLMLVTNMPL